MGPAARGAWLRLRAPPGDPHRTADRRDGARCSREVRPRLGDLEAGAGGPGSGARRPWRPRKDSGNAASAAEPQPCDVLSPSGVVWRPGLPGEGAAPRHDLRPARARRVREDPARVGIQARGVQRTEEHEAVVGSHRDAEPCHVPRRPPRAGPAASLRTRARTRWPAATRGCSSSRHSPGRRRRCRPGVGAGRSSRRSSASRRPRHVSARLSVAERHRHLTRPGCTRRRRARSPWCAPRCSCRSRSASGAASRPRRRGSPRPRRAASSRAPSRDPSRRRCTRRPALATGASSTSAPRSPVAT